MALGIIVILLILAITYIHYLYGFFSAALSALICVISALVAVGWHERAVDAILGGKFADSAQSLMLAVLFCGTYMVLRIVVDKLVPGNVRFPVLIDKIGAPVMGLIAGVFATGVLVIAAEALPFYPSIGGYERYPGVEKSTIMRIVGASQEIDRRFMQIDKDKFMNEATSNASSLFPPVDEWVLSFFNRCNLNCLSTGESFQAIHPDYLKELFGQRLGIEGAARHVSLINTLKVTNVFMDFNFVEVDGELGGVRFEEPKKSFKGVQGKPTTPDQIALKQIEDQSKLMVGGPPRLHEPRQVGEPPLPGDVFVIVRASIDAIDADQKDQIFRCSPASVRLVSHSIDAPEPSPPTDYFCIGTMRGSMFIKQSPDDFMFIEAGATVDFVFSAKKGDLFGNLPPDQRKLPPGAFLEVKRQARADASNVKVVSPLKPMTTSRVIYKQGLLPDMPKEGTAPVAPAPAPPPAAAVPGKIDGALLIGSWQNNTERMNPAAKRLESVVTTMHYLKDGTYSITVKYDLAQRGIGEETTAGTWKLQGNLLTRMIEKSSNNPASQGTGTKETIQDLTASTLLISKGSNEGDMIPYTRIRD